MASQRVIERFITTYRQRRDYFRRVAELCHDQCRDALIGEAIQHIASFRAKHPDRLHEKLVERLRIRPERYPDEETIEADIPDLAGVRIALYFPGDAPSAAKVLSAQFQVDAEKRFPPEPVPKSSLDEKPIDIHKRRGSSEHEYRFAGYSATHLRVRLKSETLRKQYPEEADEYAKARIEIQIASVFMHAWAEVEHDLVYKPLNGVLSKDEYLLLDQVNGLAYAAEMALEQLQRARAKSADRRAPFQNHYDLASCIHTRVAQGAEQVAAMGRADRLLTFLRKQQIDNSEHIEPFLRQVKVGPRSLVDQMVEAIINADAVQMANRRTLWRQIEQTATVGNPYDGTVGMPFTPQDVERHFRKHWATFNEVARRVLGGAASSLRREAWPDAAALEQKLRFDAQTSRTIMSAYDAFTRVVSGHWKGSDDQLERFIALLEEAIRHLYTSFPTVLGDQWSDT